VDGPTVKLERLELIIASYFGKSIMLTKVELLLSVSPQAVNLFVRVVWRAISEYGRSDPES
jgi:hypothetical protein